MARFLMTAMPFTGHVLPLCAVAQALVARGHDVRCYTGGAFRARVEASGAVHVPWREAPDFDENDLRATFPRLEGRKGLRQVFLNLEDVMIDTAPAQVADLQAEWDREPWDALVTDDTSIGAGVDLDKPEIAARVAWVGAGVDLRTGTPTAARVAAGFERAVTDRTMTDAAAGVAAELSSLGGAPRAAELLEGFAARAGR